MANTIRVYNHNKFDVGVKTFDNKEHNIKPGSFIPLTEDDIAYISSISTLFSRGILRVEDAKEQEVLEAVGVVKEDNTNFMDDNDIKKKLGMSAAKIEAWLKDIDDQVLLHRIADIAKGIDLANSKMKVILARIPSAEE